MSRQAAKLDNDNNLPQLKRKQLVQKLKQVAKRNDAMLRQIELPAGHVLFAQDDPAESMYLLISGELGVRRRHPDGTEAEIDLLMEGAVVGELALLSGQNRSATVYAQQDCVLLQLSKEEFEELSSAEQNELVDMQETVVTRWRRLQLSKALHRLFGQLNTAVLHQLQAELEWFHLSNGDILFHQNEPSDGMYIVLSGRIRFIVTDDTGAIVTSNEVGPSETIGEYALINEEPRTATAFAVRETNLVKMTAEQFTQLAQAYPHMMGQLAQIIVARQQRGLKQRKPVAPGHLTVAIVPMSSTVTTNVLARELAAEMSIYGATMTLNSTTFDSKLAYRGASQTASDSPNNPVIVALLDELEANQKYLLYVADPALSNWTRRCVGQADRVLLVADATESPQPGPVEKWLADFEVPLRTELVLWHPAATERPKDTALFLNQRAVNIHTHHHIRQGTPTHTARLARRLTGHAIGLVLSGGSARGYAHLGVHRAMTELGIPLDYIGGTSMGALLGAAMSLYPEHETLMQLALHYADTRKFFDRTLPFTALMRSRKLTQSMQELFGEWQIEDLWVPFFCVATNLTTAVPIIYQQGSLWQAVRASIAIPGVFAPVIQEGEVLVDGGVINNFPAAFMADLCESARIIGVNVTAQEDTPQSYDFEHSVSGWHILLSRLNPFAPSLRAPSVVNIILRAFEINSIYRAREEAELVDLLIYPDVQQFASTAYEQCPHIVEVGYATAREPLRLWWEAASVANSS